MKTKILIFGLFFLITGCASNKINQLYQKSPAFYSYIFGDVTSSRIFKEYKSDVYTPVASCQKIITALLAYKILGPDYQYETKLFITKPHHNKRDVVISFSGDPTLKTADLMRLLVPIKKSNINGKIFLDISEFKTPEFSSGIMLDDLATDYAPPVSSLIVDENSVNVVVYADQKNNLSLVTNDANYHSKSIIKTSADPSLIKTKWEDNVIYLEGNINFKDYYIETKISPVDFNYFILKKMKPIFKNLGMKNEIIIIRDANKLPTNRDLANVVKSDLLSKIITKALKISDNLALDALYLKIIHLYGGDKIKNWSDGGEVIKDLVKKYFDVDLGSSKIVDGSGLSRYNQIPPRKLFMILKQAYNQKEFVSGLAGAGEPGSTLAKRAELATNIKAKTGNISGISCLCGYGIGKKPTVFVIVVNGFTEQKKKIFSMMDNLVNYFVEKAL
jgi:serine-type D-Ala-D-Ala carboxypeptidase/endopeptidase (penicillin-binding protein 4)